MKLKVCGLKDVNNIQMLHYIQPDMMGFIFVRQSPRFVELDDEMIKTIRKTSCETVGVFVNEPNEVIKDLVEILKLDYVQLHGDETPSQINEIAQFCKVIKAFSVSETFDFDLDDYDAAQLFLFDTKGNRRGGNGLKFNWNLLRNYNGSRPFLLSGGIRITDAAAIKKINHPKFLGVDINSGFESYPGIKSIDLVAQLKLEVDEVYS